MTPATVSIGESNGRPGLPVKAWCYSPSTPISILSKPVSLCLPGLEIAKWLEQTKRLRCHTEQWSYPLHPLRLKPCALLEEGPRTASSWIAQSKALRVSRPQSFALRNPSHWQQAAALQSFAPRFDRCTA